MVFHTKEGPPCSGPSIVLSAMGGDSYAPLTRGETHEEIAVPGPTFAANDNETLDHLLSLVDDVDECKGVSPIRKERQPQFLDPANLSAY